MTITPLATACPAPLQTGFWRCHSHFRHAINLQHPQGDLLTLLCTAPELTPMGWLLARTDFHAISSRLKPGQTLHMTQDGLHGNGFHISRPRRCLALNPAPTPQLPDLASHLTGIPHPTGLCGPLNRALQQPDSIQARLFAILNAWFTTGAGVPATFIGLGPGLTPSADDMVIGALALLHTSPELRAQMRSRSLLSNLDELHTLTTPVSACYLNHASQGRFSSALIRLLRRLTRGSPATNGAIAKLLAHGHTSGADTLLGICVAQRWLSVTYPGAVRYV